MGELELSGCGAFILAKKLANVRERLRHWAKFNFGSINLRKLDLLDQIEKLDISKEASRLSIQELH